MTKTKAFLIGVVGSIVTVNIFFLILYLFDLFGYFKASAQFNTMILFLIPIPFITLYLGVFKKNDLNLKTLLMSWLGGVFGTPSALFIYLTIITVISGGK
jgi:hypothetical protein